MSGTVSGQTFTATLRIEEFFTSGGQIFGVAYLEKVKGVSKAIGDQLEGSTFTYSVSTLSWSCSSLQLMVYPYTNTTNLGSTLSLSPTVVTVNSSTPRYDLLGSTLCDIQTELNQLSSGTGGSIANLVVLYNKVASTVGKY
ncbi:hypothetical protein B0919_16025 [Hymenobacter sp. CRA2]|nr:hypothetical protein B0919_16025 [Hymenobacter sp. CRA2]